MSWGDGSRWVIKRVAPIRVKGPRTWVIRSPNHIDGVALGWFESFNQARAAFAEPVAEHDTHLSLSATTPVDQERMGLDGIGKGGNP